MWLTMIARNWQAAVIALLGLGLALSLSHGRYLSAKLDAKTAEIDFMAREAQAFNERSKVIARQTNEQHIAMVEQAKKTAYANYLKKYGANAACGLTVRLPNMPAGAGEASSPEVADGVSESEFISACALDAGHLQLWQQWAIANDLPVQ